MPCRVLKKKKKERLSCVITRMKLIWTQNADGGYLANVNHRKFQVAVYVYKLFCTLHFSRRFPPKWLSHFRHYMEVQCLNGYAVKANQGSRPDASIWDLTCFCSHRILVCFWPKLTFFVCCKPATKQESLFSKGKKKNQNQTNLLLASVMSRLRAGFFLRQNLLPKIILHIQLNCHEKSESYSIILRLYKEADLSWELK